eukprot:m.192953 g.192953  ORF g.192953 m.192953 type:complete len:77 (-) comp14871_c0_seq3:499-729(-)
MSTASYNIWKRHFDISLRVGSYFLLNAIVGPHLYDTLVPPTLLKVISCHVSQLNCFEYVTCMPALQNTRYDDVSPF